MAMIIKAVRSVTEEKFAELSAPVKSSVSNFIKLFSAKKQTNSLVNSVVQKAELLLYVTNTDNNPDTGNTITVKVPVDESKSSTKFLLLELTINPDTIEFAVFKNDKDQKLIHKYKVGKDSRKLQAQRDGKSIFNSLGLNRVLELMESQLTSEAQSTEFQIRALKKFEHGLADHLISKILRKFKNSAIKEQKVSVNLDLEDTNGAQSEFSSFLLRECTNYYNQNSNWANFSDIKIQINWLFEHNIRSYIARVLREELDYELELIITQKYPTK
jgi:hypothetical protein